MPKALPNHRLVCDRGIAWSETGLCLRHYLIRDWFVTVILPGQRLAVPKALPNQRLVCDRGIAWSETGL